MSACPVQFWIVLDTRAWVAPCFDDFASPCIKEGIGLLRCFECLLHAKPILVGVLIHGQVMNGQAISTSACQTSGSIGLVLT